MSKKGENIYKRKDNRWEARYIKEYTPFGSAKYGYCYGKTYREVKEKVTKAKSQLLAGMQPVSNRQKRRLSYYCDEWLYMKKSHIKESTYDKYKNTIDKHIKEHLGDCLIQSINSVVVERFSQELRSEDNLSAKTVRDILIVLKSVLTYISKQTSTIIPMIEITYPKEKKKEMRVLSREEQKQLVKCLLDKTDEYKFGILLALSTGMRIGEICALKWKDISFEKNRLMFLALCKE